MLLRAYLHAMFVHPAFISCETQKRHGIKPVAASRSTRPGPIETTQERGSGDNQTSAFAL